MEMDTSCDQSTLEILPDEILLEVCKYLLCNDVLHSFIGLNYRITRMIAQYRHHLSFHKTSISKFDYLCMNVLPQIGSQIRSLVIDCCYSLLQDRLFFEYFSENMSNVFPNLERISLVAYVHDDLVAFLNALHDLNHLAEIRLYSLFSIQRLQQPALARLLMQANNHRLTTIFLDNHSSTLSFDETDRYWNIVRLCLKLKTLADLPSLFVAVPNVQHLDVTIEKRNPSETDHNVILRSSLLHLTHFRLKSVERRWTSEELMALLVQLPIVQCLSLFLYTYDERLVKGDIVLSLLPSTVQKFNYAVYFYSNIISDEDNTIASSWPPSHPVAYFFDNKLFFLHTLPWHFTRLEFSSTLGKMISSQTINANGYDKHTEQVCLFINKNFSLDKALTILSQCRRVSEVIISVTDNSDIVEEKQPSVSSIPKLSRVIQIWFHGLIPSDLHYFSIILNALPNLFRLDLSIDYLLRLIEEPQICSILDQRITSLCIFEHGVNASPEKLNEKHLPIIASALSRICDLYVNIMHLPSSKNKISTSSEDIFAGSFLQDLFAQSSQQQEDEDEVIWPLSTESMLLYLLTTFKEHKLISLCVDGHFLEKIETDTEQWLQANTNLGEQKFKAAFNSELNRLLIWM